MSELLVILPQSEAGSKLRNRSRGGQVRSAADAENELVITAGTARVVRASN